MELLILKNDPIYFNLSNADKLSAISVADDFKQKNFEDQLPRKGDIIEVHDDGYFTDNLNRLKCLEKNNAFILIVVKNQKKLNNLIQTVYEDVEKKDKSKLIKQVLYYSKFNIDVSKHKIIKEGIDKIIIEDFKSLKLYDKVNKKELTSDGEVN